MYDFFDFRPDNKEMALAILTVFIVLVVCFCAGYCVGWERAEDLYNNGAGVGNAGEQLGTAVSNQQSITEGIQNAEHTSVGIAETSTAIADTAKHIEAGVNEAGAIIDSSQQILGAIRNRGQTNPPAN